MSQIAPLFQLILQRRQRAGWKQDQYGEPVYKLDYPQITSVCREQNRVNVYVYSILMLLLFEGHIV